MISCPLKREINRRKDIPLIRVIKLKRIPFINMRKVWRKDIICALIVLEWPLLLLILKKLYFQLQKFNRTTLSNIIYLAKNLHLIKIYSKNQGLASIKNNKFKKKEVIRFKTQWVQVTLSSKWETGKLLCQLKTPVR